MALTALATRFGFEEAMETLTPSAAASFAAAAPIPDEPPMIRIDWPLIEGILLDFWKVAFWLMENEEIQGVGEFV